jgi:ubiquinone/menaquinone biosynthesis C-methylase UbiE
MFSSEALDHLFFKQLYRGISLHDWGDKQPNAVLDVGCGIGSWILDAARVWSVSHFSVPYQSAIIASFISSQSTNLFVGFDVVQIQPDLALIQDESLRLAQRVRWVHGNLYVPAYLVH